MPRHVTELLRLMVRVNSVNPDYGGPLDGAGRLAGRLAEIAESWGLVVEWQSVPEGGANLLVSSSPPDARPWRVFDSHLDTVSAEGMSIDPFGAVETGGRIYGRGACDTKGTGAAMLWALKEHVAAGGGPRRISVLLSVDEESGMTGVRAFLAGLETGEAIPASVIVGEPTELHPVIAHNGIHRWRLTVRGKACHASVPHEGRSAISLMARLIQRFEEAYAGTLEAEHPLTGRACCTVNTIRGGTAVNIVPERCTAEIDRRVVPGEPVAPMLPAAEAALAPLLAGEPPGTLHQEVFASHPPLSDARNGPLADEVAAALKRHALPAMRIGAPFGTHAGFLDQAGIPALVFGPGDPAPAHQAEEWIDLKQLELGVRLYRALMA